ncbi:hypothetical protein, partial [Pseudomonas juntendi]|uniref:hypothetical protein n=1 Tax=Pseudomonas juntendi TaxID=2666183 RepID=UPI003D66317B
GGAAIPPPLLLGLPSLLLSSTAALEFISRFFLCSLRAASIEQSRDQLQNIIHSSSTRVVRLWLIISRRISHDESTGTLARRIVTLPIIHSPHQLRP